MSNFLPLNFWLSTNREDTSPTEGTKSSLVGVSNEKCFFAKFILIDISLSFEMTKQEQEWSSMESNSYENWDEIEMFFGHLVIGNL